MMLSALMEPSPSDRIDFGAWSTSSANAPVLIIGDANVRPWGLGSRDRIGRLARRRGHIIVEAPLSDRAALICDANYWFEPGLLDWCAARVGRAVLYQDQVVIAHAAPGRLTEDLAAGRPPLPEQRQLLEIAPNRLFFAELSKRENALVMPLDQVGLEAAERRSFAAAYRGVSDALTCFVWPIPAFHLCRLAARIGASPNHVTAAGSTLALVSLICLWNGAYLLGSLAALLFMLLDTVDGKLARCTVRSSRFGDLFDHGVDFAFPPLAWIAWAQGAGGTREALAAAVLLIICYMMQRAIEAAFIALAGMQIHHWTRTDSCIKLVTAQRNTLVPIATAGAILGRPVDGLWAALAWSLASLAVHLARFAAALRARRRGPLQSWLASAPNQPNAASVELSSPA